MCNAVGLRQVWTVQPSGQTMRCLLTSAARSSWYFSVVDWGDSTRPAVWRRVPQHWVSWVHVLIQMGRAGGGQGKKGTKGGTNASAVSLWCWEAGGSRRGSGVSPLVPVRKRGCRSLLFSVSLFNQLLYNIFSTKLNFFSLWRTRRPSWKRFLNRSSSPPWIVPMFTLT